jgi:hypothetical protein
MNTTVPSDIFFFVTGVEINVSLPIVEIFSFHNIFFYYWIVHIYCNYEIVFQWITGFIAQGPLNNNFKSHYKYHCN